MSTTWRDALDAFERSPVSAEDVIRAERAFPYETVGHLLGHLRAETDALARLEQAAELDARFGDALYGPLVALAASAWDAAGEPELALERHLRALTRTPAWDSVLAGHALRTLAARLPEAADTLRATASRYDPEPGAPLDALAPLGDAGLADLVIVADLGVILTGGPLEARRWALACLRRGAPGRAHTPLWMTRDWEPHTSAMAHLLGVAPARDAAALLAAVHATPAGAAAKAGARKQAPSPHSLQASTRIRAWRAAAAAGDWSTVAEGWLDWHRESRSSALALLVLERGDPAATAVVEREAALSAETGWYGCQQSERWALPHRVLARRAGDASASWEG